MPESVIPALPEFSIYIFPFPVILPAISTPEVEALDLFLIESAVPLFVILPEDLTAIEPALLSIRAEPALFVIEPLISIPVPLVFFNINAFPFSILPLEIIEAP